MLMKSNHLYNFIRKAVVTVPAVIPLLKRRARWMVYSSGVGETGLAKTIILDDGSIDLEIYGEYKTYDYMLAQVRGLVSGVYNNNLGGEFIDIMANVISGQLTQAYQQALEDEGFTDFSLPDYLQESLDAMVLNQYTFVDQYYRDIVDARIDQTPIAPLLARAELWAQRWTEAYNEAVRLITLHMGGNLEWTLGQTEAHCTTCANLNGIVARAAEWDILNVHPQHAPNTKLECGGWKCDCQLSPTTKRRSPNAYGRIEEAIL